MTCCALSCDARTISCVQAGPDLWSQHASHPFSISKSRPSYDCHHLKRTLSSYFRYYHESRTHLSLGKQCPFPREVLEMGKIVAIPQLGGLHHRYERTAA